MGVCSHETTKILQTLWIKLKMKNKYLRLFEFKQLNSIAEIKMANWIFQIYCYNLST